MMMPQQQPTVANTPQVPNNTGITAPKTAPTAKPTPINATPPKKKHHGISREELRSNPTERELYAASPQDDKHFMSQLWGLH